MKEKFLNQKEIKEIVVFSFFLIQMLVKIEHIMSKIISKVMWDNVQEVLQLDFKSKIDAIYAILEQSLSRENWKELKLGKDNITFTPKQLKNVLLELSTIRNQFAHIPIFYDKVHNGVSDLGPGIIKFFLNVGEVVPEQFPLEVSFNEKLLERKKLLKISTGTIYGLNDDQFVHKYTKKDTHFKSYKDLFTYTEILSDYAFRSLSKLEEMLAELLNQSKNNSKSEQ